MLFKFVAGPPTLHSMLKRYGLLLAAGCALAIAVQVALPRAAGAYPFRRTLSRGDYGRDVRALEVRVAGWYWATNQYQLVVDRRFGTRTRSAVRAFQRFYGLTVDGIAGPNTFAALNRLEEADGSTLHFSWAEFAQNRNARCSAKANAYAGGFSGGMVSPGKARSYVRRLMWRLEALRAKAGNKAIGINSGFRSIPYNHCIGGARYSQHMYGTAADNRMADVTNRFERNLAKASQFHGIACYSGRSHNHFDLRLENGDLPGARYWWWPARDRRGRDLDAANKPCWGETATSVSSVKTTSSALDGPPSSAADEGPLIPSASEVEDFQRTGEVGDLDGAD